MLDPGDLESGIEIKDRQTDQESHIHNPESGWSGEALERFVSSSFPSAHVQHTLSYF